MHPYMIPYHKPGNRRTFEKQIAITVLQELRNGSLSRDPSSRDPSNQGENLHQDR